MMYGRIEKIFRPCLSHPSPYPFSCDRLRGVPQWPKEVQTAAHSLLVAKSTPYNLFSSTKTSSHTWDVSLTSAEDDFPVEYQESLGVSIPASCGDTIRRVVSIYLYTCMNKLPSRLRALTQWFLPHTLIDIGCDHGWLPIVSFNNGWDRFCDCGGSSGGTFESGIQTRKGSGGAFKWFCPMVLDDIDVPMGSVVSIAGMGGAHAFDFERAPLFLAFDAYCLSPIEMRILLRASCFDGMAYDFRQRHRRAGTIFSQLVCKSQYMVKLEQNRWHWEESWLTKNPSEAWKRWLMQRHAQIADIEQSTDCLYH